MPVIKAENLGKKYVIGHQAERGGYTALRDVLMLLNYCVDRPETLRCKYTERKM